MLGAGVCLPIVSTVSNEGIVPGEEGALLVVMRPAAMAAFRRPHYCADMRLTGGLGPIAKIKPSTDG